MNIILVPGKRGRAQNACFSHRHLLVFALVGLIGLPAFFGALTYRIHDMLARAAGEGAQIAVQERELGRQRAVVETARREASTHINALALRLGSLQAQVLRLNALGSRLTRMAGLDGREFSFDAPPAMGGPEKVGASSPTPDIVKSLDKLSSEIERSRARLQALESLLLDRKLSAKVTPSGWPVDGGWVSSGYGLRVDPFTGHQSMHEGADIASRMGSQIQAMGDGVVSHAGDKPGYGLMVEITHESGLVTRYAHTRAVLVKVGDKVTKGQTIALVGSTGRSTGPHLHFEVVRDGRAVNPARYLQQQSEKIAQKPRAKTI